MHARPLGLFLCFPLALALSADSRPATNVRPNPLFGDHMVVQQGMAVPVWGEADPGGTVSVTFNGQAKEGVVGADGRWQVRLASMPAGGPHEMVISGEKSLTIKDALVGEVWLCSGQSNMEFRLRDARDAKAEIAAADHPRIRVFKTRSGSSPKPLDRMGGRWVICSPKAAGMFTAVGYFFGRELHQHLNVPVGLIDSSVGVTAAEAWTSRETLVSDPEFRPILDRYEAALKRYPEIKPIYDQYAEPFKKLFGAKVTTGDVEDPIDKGLEEGWAKPAYDDSDWPRPAKPSIRIPFFGFTQAWAGPSVVWFRNAFTVPEAWAGKALTLHGARLTGQETVFYNGVKVGVSTSTGYHPVEHVVPGDLVKPGRAVVAMRVFSNRSRANRRFSSLKIGPPGAIVRLGNRGPYRVSWSKTDGSIELLGSCEVPMGPQHRDSPSGLYNAQIHPLMPYAIRGAAWYQGESNVGRAYQYRKLLPAMIENWRRAWKQGDFCFLIVQLANISAAPRAPSASTWAELREAQAMTAAADPNSGLAVTVDIGDPYDVHPKNKQDVGRRLALAARKLAYHEDLVYAGPTYESMVVEGDAIRIRFTNVGSGLVAKSGGPLKRFAVAGSDKAFVWADAMIERDTVVVRSDDVKDPAAVRYAWAHNPSGCNLYNREGLPACPFRTDDWPGVTSGKK